MDKQTLISKLQSNNIPERWYSINEGLKPNACIIYENYSLWEYFYLDEKGERLDYKIFSNEEEAYEHLWNKMKYQAKIFKINVGED